jgi:rhamnogalacturonyl hydrolase YesR
MRFSNRATLSIIPAPLLQPLHTHPRNARGKLQQAHRNTDKVHQEAWEDSLFLGAAANNRIYAPTSYDQHPGDF